MLGFIKQRKLRTHILLVFLTLLSLSCMTIIGYTYHRSYRSILHFSTGVIERVSGSIRANIDCLLEQFERVPEVAVGVFKRHPQISIENTALIHYFLDLVKYHPQLYAFYAGTPDGSFLGVFNLLMTANANYFGPENEAPKGAIYAMIVINRSEGTAQEEWVFYDHDLKVLSSEMIAPRGYDPRERPWYQGVVKTKKEFWTDIFLYDPTHDTGIAIGLPVFGDNGELLSVIGADLSLQVFSLFITQQRIGQYGKAFIVDRMGDIVLPTEFNIPYREVVPTVYASYQAREDANLIVNFEGEKYLASVTPFPVPFNPDWKIVVVDPISDFFGDLFQTQNQLFLISLIILLIAAICAIFLAHHISSPIAILSNEVRKIQHLELNSRVRISSDIEEINLMDSSIDAMRSAIRSFGKYVPKEVVNQLIEHGHKIAIGGENREVTIFFSDISNFTAIAENLSPEQVTSMLASYFAVLSNIIIAHHGTIDKYLGDGIMAFWGAPEQVENPTSFACLTALLCETELKKFNQRQKEKQEPLLETRIGINVGNAIVGNIGTDDRMNYTVLGDIVNTTARFQALNKIYRTEIILGEEAVKKIDSSFLVRPLDYVEIKGKKQKVRIYELMGFLEGPKELLASNEEKELAAAFGSAYEAFHNGNLQEAKTLFEAIGTRFPNDYPTQLFLNRLKP